MSRFGKVDLVKLRGELWLEYWEFMFEWSGLEFWSDRLKGGG